MGILFRSGGGKMHFFQTNVSFTVLKILKVGSITEELFDRDPQLP